MSQVIQRTLLANIVRRQELREGLYSDLYAEADTYKPVDLQSQAIAHWVSKRAKFPKFKGRGHKQSWTTDEQSVQVEGLRIKLPKIGWVKMRQVLRFVGKIIKVTVTISRTAHCWFLSITVETEDTEVSVDTSTHPVIGIDVGINTLATSSDGTIYDNPDPLQSMRGN